MISITFALVVLLATFIFMYYTEMTARKRNFNWYKESVGEHMETILSHNKAIKKIDEQITEYKKAVDEYKADRAEEKKVRTILYLNFAEWVNELETQTLTDELKEEIVRHANFDMD